MSNRFPWMPLDIPAYRNDTGHLTTLQHGAYMLLLMHYWCQGPLPDDDEQLAAFARMDAKAWDANKKTIRRFFSLHNGELHQKRADIERERAADISAKRRAAAGDRWNSPANGDANAPAKAPPDAMQMHSTCTANGAVLHPHTVPSTVQTVEVREKESLYKKPLPSKDLDGSRARVAALPPDELKALLDEVAKADAKPSADGRLSDNPAIEAHIRRVAKACAMQVPYGETRSAEVQAEAIVTQPGAVGADETMGLRFQPAWQPEDPMESARQQLVTLLGISPEEAEARLSGAPSPNE